MKIALNATIATKTRTGTGHYAANLTAALMRVEHDHEFVIYCNREMVDWFADRRNGGLHSIRGIRCRSAPERVFWEQTQLGGDLKRRGVELLHSMAFTSPYFNPLRTVVTVHDLVFRHYPETISLVKRLYYPPVFTRSIKQASRIITGSETVRDEMIRALGLPPARVIAIPEAAGLEFRPTPGHETVQKTCGKWGITQPYFLTVGTLEPRKNLLVLIKAFDLMKRESNLRHKLVVAGKKGWLKIRDPEISAIINTSDDIIFTGYVAEEDMPALYAGAELFLFPSLYEGFGLPLLEACANGVPVLASDIAVHREVCGDAAWFVTPGNIVEWKDAILSLMMDREMKSHLIEKGSERVKAYSWERTAEKTLEVYGMDSANGQC